MIKNIILTAFLLPTLSFIEAKAISHENPFSYNKISNIVEKIKQEKVPKTVIIKTKKFKIRIDLQPNGNYLYQSWGANSKITSKPNMIISDGSVTPDGSGGNYYYEFNNNGFVYQIYRNYLTDSATKPPYTLVVTDANGKTIVNQDGKVVKY